MKAAFRTVLQELSPEERAQVPEDVVAPINAVLGQNVELEIVASESLQAAKSRALSLLFGDSVTYDLTARAEIGLVDILGKHVKWDTYIDAKGRAVWNFDPQERSFEELRRTVNAQVVFAQTDRFNIVFDLVGGRGGGNGIDYWQQLTSLVMLAKPYVEAAGVVSGGVGAIVQFGKSVRWFRKRWSQRGVRIDRLDNLLRVPRTTGQVASFLDCSRRHAERTCRAFAMRRDSTGVWRATHNPTDEAKREILLVLGELAGWHVDEDQKDQVVREILGRPVGQRLEAVEPTLNRVVWGTDQG